MLIINPSEYIEDLVSIGIDREEAIAMARKEMANRKIISVESSAKAEANRNDRFIKRI